MKINKKSRTVLSILVTAVSLTIVGCASNASKNSGNSHDTGAMYADFLEKAPSFETQEIGERGTDGLFKAVASYAEGSNKAFQLMADLTSEDSKTFDGYRLHRTIESIRSEKGDAAVNESMNAWADSDRTQYAAYRDQKIAIMQAQTAKSGALMTAATSVLAIDKDALLKGSNMIQKAKLGKAIGIAFKQANYAKEANDWFARNEAILMNAENETAK